MSPPISLLYPIRRHLSTESLVRPRSFLAVCAVYLTTHPRSTLPINRASWWPSSAVTFFRGPRAHQFGDHRRPAAHLPSNPVMPHSGILAASPSLRLHHIRFGGICQPQNRRQAKKSPGSFRSLGCLEVGLFYQNLTSKQPQYQGGRPIRRADYPKRLLYEVSLDFLTRKVLMWAYLYRQVRVDSILAKLFRQNGKKIAQIAIQSAAHCVGVFGTGRISIFCPVSLA